MPERGPVHVRPDEGESVWSLGGRFTIKLEGQEAEGRYAVVEAVAWRSTEPPLHIHHREDEAWYILDGQMTFFVGDDSYVAPTGTFVMAPKGLPHTFTVDIEPTRVLIIAAPSGFEHFAMDLGVPAASDAPPDDLAIPVAEVLAAVAERYGIEVVGPPRRVSHPV